MHNIKRRIQPLRKRRSPVVIGTGLVALDVVIPHGLDTDPQLRAGGTCGNVLTALSYLGWNSYPIARLSEDGASKQVASDLKKWGVRLDFVTFGSEGSTPVVIQHIRNNKTGDPTHSFSRKCPCCGAFLPWYKAVRVADVTNLVPKLPTPQVYFFDRTSPGALALAKEARDLGAIVFFEPSTSSEPSHLAEALELAHIVKISSDRIASNEAVLSSCQPQIVIETQGSMGLRLRHTPSEGKKRVRKWHTMESFPVDGVKDTAGAGDWCAAGIIHMLGAMGAKGLEKLTLDEIRKAVRLGQAMAAWACEFVGPRGGMYLYDYTSFEAHVLDLCEGRHELKTNTRTTTSTTNERQVFACELCRNGSTNPAKTRAHVR